MKAVRRFLIAPSFSRLIRKERGSVRVTEGYFATQSGRNSHVLVEGGQYHLVLVSSGSGAAVEERTEVPRAHADALLDVCAGRTVYDRSRVSLGGGREAFIDRLTVPGTFDLVTVEFDSEEDAKNFFAPVWFGTEVTADEAYDRRTMALSGIPDVGSVPLTNASLDALLDALDDRGAYSRSASPSLRSNDESRVLDALRRMTTSGAETPAAAPTAPAEEPAPLEVVSDSAEDEDEAYRAWETRAAEHSAPREPQPARDDSRLDDVIAGLSQVLGGASEPAKQEEQPRRPAAVVGVDRWIGRSRRSEG